MTANVIEIAQGNKAPLGCVLVAPHTWNFAVYAPDAKQIFVHFFMPDTEELIGVYELPNRTGKVFHGAFKGLDSTWLYAIQAVQRNAYSAKKIDQKLLIDPYARRLNKPLVWSSTLYESNSAQFIPKAYIQQDSFDWQGVSKPKTEDSDTIIYELHVKGFTQINERVPENLRGRYLALADPAVIDYLTSLGVTAIQVMPIFSFMTEPHLQEMGLTNFWGYNPISFFAPDTRYAIEDPVLEFKTAVRELHKNGIEVLLDVVYNHTCESGEKGPSLSFKGLVDQEFYLRHVDDYDDYANYTGCGNTVNADSDFGSQIIMDSLRYWLEEMQVDGFRFDLAATLGRNGERFNRRAALFRAMQQDPIVSTAKLIAEPWDIGPEGYQLGNFPAQWYECNDKYRDCLRQFWRGDRGLVPELASRILGSRDVFKKGRRSQTTAVNYICYHDGFTLNDLVSYEQRHNLANLENNRDGHGSNYSANYGIEGTTVDGEIIAMRLQQQRNMISSVLFSQGIPHLLAGDEISRSQKGNNNAYCQDNEISWINWHIKEYQAQLLSFTQRCIAIRKKYPLLRHLFLADDNYEYSHYHHRVNWIRPDGEPKSLDDWQNPDNKCLGLVIGDDDSGIELLLILNASSDEHEYRLPNGLNISRVIDSSLPNVLQPETVSEEVYSQPPHSLSLWEITIG